MVVVVEVFVKLLIVCFTFAESTSFHVTIPNQPAVPQAEAILKISTPTKISAISSLNGNFLLSVPFKSLRRIGCQIALDKDILWFETCSCSQEGENFYFLVMHAGIDRAYQIVLEYKRGIELALRDHMIMEENNQSKFSYSFVVKTHYGHPEFPKAAQEQIVSNGLLSLAESGDAMSLSDLNRLTRARPSIGVIEVNNATAAPVPGLVEGGERRTPSPYNSRRSPPSPSPLSLSNGATFIGLDQVSRTSRQRGQCSSSSGFDSGVGIDSFDESRISAPCNLSTSMNASPVSWKEQKQRKTTLEDMRKVSSLDETRKFGVVTGSRKTSLAVIQQSGGVYSLPRKSHTKGDSGLGSSSDAESSSGTKGVSLAAYDHLLKKANDVSLQERSPYSARKMSSPAYVQS